VVCTLAILIGGASASELELRNELARVRGENALLRQQLASCKAAADDDVVLNDAALDEATVKQLNSAMDGNIDRWSRPRIRKFLRRFNPVHQFRLRKAAVRGVRKLYMIPLTWTQATSVLRVRRTQYRLARKVGISASTFETSKKVLRKIQSAVKWMPKKDGKPEWWVYQNFWFRRGARLMGIVTCPCTENGKRVSNNTARKRIIGQLALVKSTFVLREFPSAMFRMKLAYAGILMFDCWKEKCKAKANNTVNSTAPTLSPSAAPTEDDATDEDSDEIHAAEDHSFDDVDGLLHDTDEVDSSSTVGWNCG
jgi:hypothetical protein